jgi:uncharacterized protein
MHRRKFLKVATVAVGTSFIGLDVWRKQFAFADVVSGVGPYGPLQPPDPVTGLMLPAGFSVRIVATTYQPVANTSYLWHKWPDGGSCFATPGGGWVYVSNCEEYGTAGGASAIKFAADGTIIDAYSILSGTTRNCSGGPTPWGTYLSCEESGNTGKVFECNPLVPGQGVARPAMGSFNHEAAVCDPNSGRFYLTEDITGTTTTGGRLYRFTPTTPGDLSSGVLEAAKVTGTQVTCVPTSANEPDQQTTTTGFNGGEGAWIALGKLWFTTKGDHRVWELDLATDTLTVLYQWAQGMPLKGVDCITMHQISGDLFVGEDIPGEAEICVIGMVGSERHVAPFVRHTTHLGSEFTGVAFSPDGTRLYCSSQRGEGTTDIGVTYEISGPFRTLALPPTPPTTTTTTTTAPGGPETLVAAGATWRYLDDGSDQGTAWREPAFNDSSWALGGAPLGYGDPVTTTVSYGPSSSAKYLTTYFRRTFQATHGYQTLTVNLKRDDGAVIYVNGVEVARSNMPSGVITKATPAATNAEATAYLALPITATLVEGTNVIAVEVHQFSASSSDLFFDLTLVGTGNTGPLGGGGSGTTTTTSTSTTTTTTPPSGTVTTLPAVADTHVKDGSNAATNYGSAVKLEIRASATAGSNAVSYLKFDTTSIASPITQAKVKLWVRETASATTSQLSIHAVSDSSWSESAATWNNRPAVGASLASYSSSSTGGAWAELDVTSFVVSERAAGRTVVSVAVVQSANSKATNIHSRQNATNPPGLLVTS